MDWRGTEEEVGFGDAGEWFREGDGCHFCRLVSLSLISFFLSDRCMTVEFVNCAFLSKCKTLIVMRGRGATPFVPSRH